MFNPYSMPFQPYFIFQTPTGPVPSLILQENSAFIFPQFIYPNALQNTISSNEKAIGQGLLPSEATSSEIKAENGSLTSTSAQILQKKNIIKEKLIKKPANRPATYLTERKYYLAQPLQQ